jgi:hypothetical protein
MKSTIHHSFTAIVAAVAIAAVACSASPAHAEVIPVTSWADDIAGGNGTNDPLINSAGSAARIAGSFAQQTLGLVGDKITMTGSFVLTGSPPANQPTGVFRWGLFDHNGEPLNNGWLGYLAESDSSNGTAGSDFWRKTNTGSNYTTPGGTDALLADVEQTTGGFLANTSYGFELTATRLPGNQLQLDWILSTGFSSSITDTTPSTFSFDRVGLFIGPQLNSSAQFTDVNITTMIVPEPGTLAMLGIGTAGLALVYRRRRRG